MPKINEKDLFTNWKNNVPNAFEELYNTYNKLVYGIAFTILKNNQDSEDVVQNTFTKICNIDKNKLPTKNETSWLYSVTKNEAIAVLRKRNNDLDLDSIYEIEDDNNEIDNLIDKIEFNKLIKKLDSKEQEIVSLKILTNLPFAEIAKLLNEPTGTIKWRYYKSVNSLKMLLGSLGMFIITFVLGLKSLLNKPKLNREELETIKNEQNTVKDEDIIQSENNIEKDEIKSDNTAIQEDLRYEEKNDIKENIEQNTITQNEIVQETTLENNTNYFGIGSLSISAMFLIITIIILIFSKEYQPFLNIHSYKLR